MSYDMTSVRSLLLKADIPSNSAIFSPRLAARSIVTSGLLWGLGTQRFTSMPLGVPPTLQLLLKVYEAEKVSPVSFTSKRKFKFTVEPLVNGDTNSNLTSLP